MFAGTPVTTGAAAVCFVVLALIVAVVPVPYVAWSPGVTADLLGPADSGTVRAVEISGLSTYPTEGQLRLTTVSVTRADARLSLPAALVAHWLPGREVLPRKAVYAPGTTQQQSTAESTRMMDNAQQSAVVAGLRSAGVAVTEVPMVTGVTTGAPADGHLEPGDRLLAVDGQVIDTSRRAVELIRARPVGDPVAITVLRADRRVEVTIPTRPAKDDASVPMIGATMGVGYDHPGEVRFGISSDIGGPSAGLVFALAVHDKLTPGPLTGGRIIAATGTIDPDGTVGPIGGLESKIRGAERSGAAMFLSPRGNCADAGAVQPDIPLVPVDSLDQALEVLADPAMSPAELPHCP